MQEAWEIIFKYGVMARRIHTLSEYLQQNIQNDEHFYNNAVSTSVARISNMDKFVRRKQDLPCKNRLKKIQDGWLGRVDILLKLSATFDTLMENKSVLFLKFIDMIKELEGPILIKDSMLLNKDQVET